MTLLIQKCVSYVSFLRNKQVWLINILVQNGEKINRGIGFLGCMLRNDSFLFRIIIKSLHAGQLTFYRLLLILFMQIGYISF